jgi:hypothetical protein
MLYRMVIRHTIYCISFRCLKLDNVSMSRLGGGKKKHCNKCFNIWFGPNLWTKLILENILFLSFFMCLFLFSLCLFAPFFTYLFTYLLLSFLPSLPFHIPCQASWIRRHTELTWFYCTHPVVYLYFGRLRSVNTTKQKQNRHYYVNIRFYYIVKIATCFDP